MGKVIKARLESLLDKYTSNKESVREMSDKELFIAKAEEYREYNKPILADRISLLLHNVYVDAMIDSYDNFNEICEGVKNLLAYIEESVEDRRFGPAVKYPLSSVVIIILLAKICGANKAEDICAYYREKNLELQLFLPNLPSPRHTISESTVNRIINIISPEETESFVAALCQTVESYAEELEKAGNHIDHKIQNRLQTVAFDGQEIVNSFVRGSEDRKKKAAHIVTVFNSTLNRVMAYTSESGRNRERAAFLRLLPKLSILNNSIIMSDALNSTSEVSNAIIDAGSEFLFCVKTNGGNKRLREFIEGCFTLNPEKTLGISPLTAEETEKGHGRIDVSRFEILPGDIIPEDERSGHTGIRSIVRYVTQSQTFRKNSKNPTVKSSVRYYICSLPFNRQTLKQIKTSILEYWSVETHHGILDNPDVLNQDATQSCSKAYLSNIAGFNKYTFNFLSWKRAQLNSETKKKMTYSAVMKLYRKLPLSEILKEVYLFYTNVFQRP